jgi:hypothetical protein
MNTAPATAPHALRTHRAGAIVWTFYPHARAWCADGDGFLTVRVRASGRNQLRYEGAHVRSLPADEAQALQLATDEMQRRHPELYEHLAAP